ncbi:MAG: hypothetical protein ACM3N6_07595 [Betaproteobacteria bacterium]
MNARRLAAWAVLVAALLAVFALYLRPDMVMSVATQLWNCF